MSNSFADQRAAQRVVNQDGFHPDADDGRMAFWDKIAKKWIRAYCVDAREMLVSGCGSFGPTESEIANGAPSTPTEKPRPSRLPPPPDLESESQGEGRPLMPPQEGDEDLAGTPISGSAQLAQARSVRDRAKK